MSLPLTADTVVLLALRTLGVYQPGQLLSADDGVLGRQMLAELIDSWNTQALTVLVQDRHVYTLVAGKGDPSNPYTIGPGGDFDTGAQPRPTVIRTANLLLNTTSPYPTEIPLAILTDDQYAANPIKTIQNQQPQSLYYQASVPLGTIQLWNVPNTSANQLVLYTDQLTPQFVGASTVYDCPPGYAEAFRLSLAVKLIPFYAVSPDDAQLVMLNAGTAVQAIKNMNVPMQDLSVDGMFVQSRGSQPGYMIQTDTGDA